MHYENDDNGGFGWRCHSFAYFGCSLVLLQVTPKELHGHNNPYYHGWMSIKGCDIVAMEIKISDFYC